MATNPNASSSATVNLGFDLLSANSGSPFKGYSQEGFTVTPVSGAWTVESYGNPGPAIDSIDGAGTGGQTYSVAVTRADGFTFDSIDLYSSVTPIPYTIVGKLDGHTVFRTSGTVPNTFGNFEKVTSPYATEVIDTLDVSITSVPLSFIGSNPYGIDNIVVGTSGHSGISRCDFLGDLLSRNATQFVDRDLIPSLSWRDQEISRSAGFVDLLRQEPQKATGIADALLNTSSQHIHVLSPQLPF